MENQNEAAIKLITTLQALGYNVDKLEIKIPGNPKNFDYAEVELKLSWHRQ